MFGLNAALDTHTQNLLANKRQLSGKKKLTDDERTKLAEINSELSKYGFMYEVRDPVYAEYLKLRHEEMPHYQSEEGAEKGDAIERERAKRLVALALSRKGDMPKQ